MVNINPAQFTQNSLPRRNQSTSAERTLGVVWQDNPAPNRAPPAMPQPAPRKKDTRTAPKEIDIISPQQRITRQRKDVQLNLWVRPGVKTELQRVAKREGLSVSAAGEALLEQALQQDIHTQHGALLETILDRAVGKHLRGYSDRNASLQARNLVKTELVLGIVTNILGRQSGMDEHIMREILNDADEAARASITRITPKQKTLIDAEK